MQRHRANAASIFIFLIWLISLRQKESPFPRNVCLQLIESYNRDSPLNFSANYPEGFVEGVPPNSQLGVPVFIYIVKRTSGAIYGEITVAAS